SEAMCPKNIGSTTTLEGYPLALNRIATEAIYVFPEKKDTTASTTPTFVLVSLAGSLLDVTTMHTTISKAQKFLDASLAASVVVCLPAQSTLTVRTTKSKLQPHSVKQELCELTMSLAHNIQIQILFSSE
ncbi:hypothetical protein ACH5RR_001335, partial [Cinchona calisaya]